MTPTHFDLVSQWRVQAPLPQVWSALTDPESWPDWWPYVQQVRTLHPGDAQGLGSRRRIVWRTPLPYTLTIEVEVMEVVRHERLRGRSRGHLRGDGIWLLRSEGAHTDVTYVWRVSLQRRWMRWAAPLLAPVFRWNHRAVMAAGHAGLERHLRLRQATRPLAAAASDAGPSA